jgi:hypothetical protein
MIISYITNNRGSISYYITSYEAYIILYHIDVISNFQYYIILLAIYYYISHTTGNTGADEGPDRTLFQDRHLQFFGVRVLKIRLDRGLSTSIQSLTFRKMNAAMSLETRGLCS